MGLHMYICHLPLHVSCTISVMMCRWVVSDSPHQCTCSNQMDTTEEPNAALSILSELNGWFLNPGVNSSFGGTRFATMP
jgi:hypothetical protein